MKFWHAWGRIRLTLPTGTYNYCSKGDGMCYVLKGVVNLAT